jgi:hypothetical protein
MIDHWELGREELIMQIDRTNCMEIILHEFPAFRDRWDEHLESWNLPLDRPVALDVAEFSEFALELMRLGDDREIERLAIIIEQILADGDSIVNYTFRMMFLKQVASHSETDRSSVDRFIAKLQPVTAYYCRSLDLFDIPVVMPDGE